MMPDPGPASPALSLPSMPKSETKTDEKFVAKYRGSGKSWQPPNSVWGGLQEAGARSDQNPADRQKQLNPNDTEIDNAGLVEIPGSLFTLTEEEARRRGWGETSAKA